MGNVAEKVSFIWSVADLRRRFGRGFSADNLELMRRFYLAWPIPETASRELRHDPALAIRPLRFPLSWSHYVALLGMEADIAAVEREILGMLGEVAG